MERFPIVPNVVIVVWIIKFKWNPQTKSSSINGNFIAKKLIKWPVRINSIIEPIIAWAVESRIKFIKIIVNLIDFFP